MFRYLIFCLICLPSLNVTEFSIPSEHFKKIQKINYCNTKKCGIIGDFNLLIKTACTEFDLIEFLFDNELVRKLVDKSEFCKPNLTKIVHNVTHNFTD